MSIHDLALIERGIAQRARLLDALLADLYGPQRLLALRLVPSELVFGHPDFLWPAHGLVPHMGRWLHACAADLARTPDGRWWVLADHTGTPFSAGRALMNRDIIRQLLALMNPDEEPLAVVLRPGPGNEARFRYGDMAHQPGIPLAAGHDLSVRDDTLFLKTPAGLKRVHCILRCLEDDCCDPLELRSDSALGVAGLLGVVRAQRVLLANALGSGVLESAAWFGFLPGIAEHLLGESLVLPSLASWWCGEAEALQYVLEHVDDLVIRAVFPNQHFGPVSGRSIAGAERDRLIARLRARPNAYVAQEHMEAAATLPVCAFQRGGAGSGEWVLAEPQPWVPAP